MAKKKNKINRYRNSRKAAGDWLKSHDLTSWFIMVPTVIMVILLLSVAAKF